MPADARRERVLAALLSHVTVKGAAAAIGLHERTMRRYLEDPAFAAEYRQRCERAASLATACIAAAAEPALDVLVRAAPAGGPRSKCVPPPRWGVLVRHDAVLELERRVAELERRRLSVA